MTSTLAWRRAGLLAAALLACAALASAQTDRPRLVVAAGGMPGWKDAPAYAPEHARNVLERSTFMLPNFGAVYREKFEVLLARMPPGSIRGVVVHNHGCAGQWVFESKGACWRCHTPPLFTDEDFHNTGVGVRNGVAEPGRAGRTGNAADTGKWKTATLRGVRFTAPFMHDGSLATLEDVVEFYARGGEPNPHLDAKMKPLDLTADDKRHLVACLKSL